MFSSNPWLISVILYAAFYYPYLICSQHSSIEVGQCHSHFLDRKLRQVVTCSWPLYFKVHTLVEVCPPCYSSLLSGLSIEWSSFCMVSFEKSSQVPCVHLDYSCNFPSKVPISKSNGTGTQYQTHWMIPNCLWNNSQEVRWASLLPNWMLSAWIVFPYKPKLCLLSSLSPSPLPNKFILLILHFSVKHSN